MMRFLMSAMMIVWACAASAQGWTATVSVSGAERGTYTINGQGNSLMANASGAYFSADTYAEGVNAGRTTCRNAQLMEVDYFFGEDAAWEGHVLFTAQRNGNRYEIIDPTLFYSRIDRMGNAVETYANYDTVKLGITDVTCRADGTLLMGIQFQGRLLSDYGDGNVAVQFSGTTRAPLAMQDMSEY